MSSIYSVRFAIVAASSAGSPTNVWTVPAGFVDILRDIDGLCTATAVTVAAVKVGADFVISLECPANAFPVTWRGRQVFEAGETITVQPNAGTLFAAFSGYRLAA